MTDPQPPRTTRYRRRHVPHIRLTWLAMVGLLLYLVYRTLMEAYPMGIVPRAGLFLLIVVLPWGLLGLWRAGLLPPERVAIEDDMPPSP